MEKQTVFIKRYPSKGEFPNKDKTWVIANGTGLNYFNGVFECPHTGEVQENIQWWLEEVELPSGEGLSYDTETPTKKGSSLWWYAQGFKAGANYILNKLKGGKNEKLQS